MRGNASEILALSKLNSTKTKGVDSTAQSGEAIEAAIHLHRQYGSVVCISGETDIIISNHSQLTIKNGDAMMTKVTGLGCSATAVIGAFIAVVDSKVEAVAAAVALVSIAGEIAAKTANGPGSLQMLLLDKLHNITEIEFKQHLNLNSI